MQQHRCIFDHFPPTQETLARTITSKEAGEQFESVEVAKTASIQKSAEQKTVTAILLVSLPYLKGAGFQGILKTARSESPEAPPQKTS